MAAIVTTAKASLISYRSVVCARPAQGFLQRLYREHRGRGKPLGRVGKAAVTGDARQRRDAAFVGLRLAHQDQRRGAVRDRRRAGGRYGAAVAAERRVASA